MVTGISPVFFTRSSNVDRLPSPILYVEPSGTHVITLCVFSDAYAVVPARVIVAKQTRIRESMVRLGEGRRMGVSRYAPALSSQRLASSFAQSRRISAHGGFRIRCR